MRFKLRTRQPEDHPQALSMWAVTAFLILYIAGSSKAQSICQNMEPSPKLEKFVDPLPVPPTISLLPKKTFTLGAYKISQKLHRDLPPTTLYAYGACKETAAYPGPTLLARRGIPARIWWQNHIFDESHFLTADKSIHMANPRRGVPIVTHLHGMESPSTSDGFPDAWFTANGEKGPAWTNEIYEYPNAQFPTTLWYHDHTVGITRLNVYAGLAGFYLLKCPEVEQKFNLPSGQFDLPLLIQDRQFYRNGSLNFPNVGLAPQIHPNWCPEFFGDTVLVNGKIWPFLNVEARKYRLRFLNGANARFFTLSFSSPSLSFLKIGTDGGYLPYPRRSSSITLAPAYRVDTIIDFSSIPHGTDIFLINSAPAPFPDGDSPSGGSEAVMKFHVVPAKGSDPPIRIAPIFPPLQTKSSMPIPRRSFTLDEFFTPDNITTSVRINRAVFSDPVTETPKSGSTVIWEIINLTEDAHPIHMHLIFFKVLDQQAFDRVKYTKGLCSMDLNSSISESCFIAEARPPAEDDVGWKDTAIALPGYVTRLYLRFMSQTGLPFPFDPSLGPGYVWHCHILDHEDNEMMRPFVVTP